MMLRTVLILISSHISATFLVGGYCCYMWYSVILPVCPFLCSNVMIPCIGQFGHIRALCRRPRGRRPTPDFVDVLFCWELTFLAT